MKKAILFVAVSAFVGFTALSASADEIVPGAYFNQVDPSVMYGTSILDMGAADRIHVNMVNLAHGAALSRNSDIGRLADWQFGSSQTENSLKAMRTLEDAGIVTGVVIGDCRGDNSSDAYRTAMNQSRTVSPIGGKYFNEPLVSQADCQEIHATVK